MQSLDNPIWFSLKTSHSHLAVGNGRALRYPPEYTPFVAVPDRSGASAEAMREMVQPGEKVGVLAVIPEDLSGFVPVKEFDIVQYIWDQADELVWEAEAVELRAEHIPQMLELTALVYPAYFRAQTASLGRYFGAFDEGKLCAMAGVRMRMTEFQEISAVCTHPDYRGKGWASRLSRHVISAIQEAGDVPFLHTEFDNVAAQSVYDRLGLRRRATIPFKVMERV